MVRICDAINRYSKIKVVGLCHQIYAGYAMVGYVLADELGIQLPRRRCQHPRRPAYWGKIFQLIRASRARCIDIKAAGLNHFTWMMDIRDRRTGEDLYPALREGWDKAARLVRAAHPPRLRCLWLDARPRRRAPGRIPALVQRPADQTLGEIRPQPVRLGRQRRPTARKVTRRLRLMGEGKKSIDQLKDADSEGALEVIEAVSGAGNDYHLAVNLPNTGQISNLPLNTIVETPAVLTGHGPAPGGDGRPARRRGRVVAPRSCRGQAVRRCRRERATATWPCNACCSTPSSPTWTWLARCWTIT